MNYKFPYGTCSYQTLDLLVFSKGHDKLSYTDYQTILKYLQYFSHEIYSYSNYFMYDKNNSRKENILYLFLHDASLLGTKNSLASLLGEKMVVSLLGKKNC